MAQVDPEALAKEFGTQPEDKTVSDKYEGLAKDFGYDPDYKEPEKPVQSFWQGLQNDHTLLGATKRLGIGALRGAKDVLDTGAHGLGKIISYVADKTLPDYIAGPLRQNVENIVKEDTEGRDTFNKEYPPSEGIVPSAAEIGRMGGQIAATLPVMPTKAFAAINAGVKALPTINAAGQKIAAPLINRLVAASGTGALGGATLGASTSSTNNKSLSENIGEGTIAGAIGGPIIEGAAQLGKGVANKIVGKISDKRAQLAERAEQLGINLKATQVSDSPTLKKYDQISGMLPFSGAQGLSQKQINQFTKAVSNTFGKDIEEITPDIIKTARKDIGNNMSNVYKNATVKADAGLQNDLTRIIQEVSTNLPDAEKRPIFNNIKNIVDKIDTSTDTINGETFNALVKYDATLSKLQKSTNPNIKNYANEIRSSLESALTRSLPVADRDLLNGYRRQYKSVMTIKDMVENDPEGKVNPLKLMRKVTQAPGGKVGSGELGELADIGREFFINPSDSGTPLGTYILNNIAPAIHNPVSAAAAAGGALMKGAAFADLGFGALGLGVNRLAREAVNSKTVKEGIIKAGRGATSGKLDYISQSIEPYSSYALMNRNKNENKPLQITVTPKTLKLPTALEKK